MISERAWRARLFSVVSAAGAAALFYPGCLGQSSCPDGAPWNTQCFTKADLATDGLSDADVADGSDAGGTPPLLTCPSTQEISETRLRGAMVDSVREQGDGCCYRYIYPCEGRPLLDSDEPILAESVARSDWSGDVLP